MGTVTYGYDRGLLHLEIPVGTAVDELPMSPLGARARHVPLYHLQAIEAQLRLDPGRSVEHPHGSHASPAPGSLVRAVALGALGLAPDRTTIGCVRRRVSPTGPRWPTC